ncbi:MAG: hypothetical protein ABI533_06940 [Betaproteobacteria bacterium]
MTSSDSGHAGALARLRDAFDDASRSPAQRRVYRLAGACVAVDSGDAATPPLTALEPLRVADDAPAALVIRLFDGSAFSWPAGIALPNEGPGLTAVNAAGMQAYLQPDIGSATLYDHHACRGYVWYRNASRLPYYEHAAPLRHLLQWWMLGRGGIVLHSAAVGGAGGGILIAGPSGAGKSSTALACLASGLQFVGDDYVAVDCRAPITAHALYATAKVRRESLGRHPAFTGHFSNLDRLDEKPMLFVHRIAPQRLAPQMPVRALVVPNVARASRTTFAPLAAPEALRAIAPSSILQFPLAGADALARIATLCRHVPTYRLHLSTDETEIVAAIEGFLAQPVVATPVESSRCA